MNRERPNFYDLLGLDPAVDDEAEIKRAIDGKKKRWNHIRTQKTGKKRAEAEAALGWVDEMRRVLADPTARRAEAEARRRQLEAAKQTAYEELDQRIVTLRSLGGCSQEQLERLVDQLAGRLERHEIEQRLAAAGIAVGVSGKAEKAPFEARTFLSNSHLEDIVHALGVLNEGSLYTFLGAFPQTPTVELVERAKKRYQESAGRSDERSTMVQKLAGIAEDIFLKTDGKERYEASTATLSLRRLHGDFDLMVEAGELRYDAFQLVARAAEDHGVDPDLARSYLGWYASERGWAIAEPAAQDSTVGFEQLFARMEDTLRQVQRARQQDQQRWDEERQRMEEVAKAAAVKAATEAAAKAAATTKDPSPPLSSPGVDTPSSPSSGLRAPSTLHVERFGKGFRLQWPPVPGASIGYWVVRKRDGYPEDEGDGELQERALETSFEDPSVPMANWYYAVFTLRDDQTSLDAAMSGPHRPKAGSVARVAAVATTGVAATVAAVAFLWPVSLPPPPPPPPPHEEKAEVPPPPPPQEPRSPGASQAIVPLPSTLPPPAHKPKKNIPMKPKVAVLAGGDRQLTPAVERKLREELAQRGLEVVGRNQLLRLDDHLVSGGRGSISQLLAGSSLDGADVLVYADVDRLGERELRFLGRSELAITSQIGVEAYLVAEQKSLGSGWSEQLEYTQVNLGQKLEESVYGLGDEVLRAVDAGWSDYRQRQGLTP